MNTTAEQLADALRAARVNLQSACDATGILCVHTFNMIDEALAVYDAEKRASLTPAPVLGEARTADHAEEPGPIVAWQVRRVGADHWCSSVHTGQEWPREMVDIGLEWRPLYASHTAKDREMFAPLPKPAAAQGQEGGDWRDSDAAPNCPTISYNEPVKLVYRDAQNRRNTSWRSAQDLGDLMLADIARAAALSTPVSPTRDVRALTKQQTGEGND